MSMASLETARSIVAVQTLAGCWISTFAQSVEIRFSGMQRSFRAASAFRLGILPIRLSRPQIERCGVKASTRGSSFLRL